MTAGNDAIFSCRWNPYSCGNLVIGPEEFKFLEFVIPLLPQLSGFSSSPVTAVARSTGLCGPPVSDGPLCFFRFEAPARLLRDFLLDTAQETTLGLMRQRIGTEAQGRGES